MRLSLLLLLFLMISVSLTAKETKKQKRKGPRATVKKIALQRDVLLTSGKIQNVTIDVDIVFQKPYKGKPVNGHNLWEVSLWLSRLKNGKGDHLAGFREGQVLSETYSGQAINRNDDTICFDSIDVVVDLRGQDCRKLNFICASFISRTPAVRVKNSVGCSAIDCQDCISEVCTMDYSPVCGSDGLTYNNLCHFKNAACENVNLIIASEEECEPACGSEYCTVDYTPVCGSDGKTYTNLCQFNNAVCDDSSLNLTNDGECEPDCGSAVCTTDYTPVCGSDGQTYSNLCNFNNAVCDNSVLTMVNEGECEPACGSDFCTTDYTPVCGSDGQTYSNLCKFDNAVCDNPELVLVNEGECVPACGSDFCTTDYIPVCGSDGQTYSNLCKFSNAVCDNSELVVVNEGECISACGSDFCTTNYSPVCGSDGQTYSNVCKFNNAVCDNPELIVVNQGECVPDCGSDFCSEDYTPVCGSDGQTYSNLCHFIHAMCDNPELAYFVNEGECEPVCQLNVCNKEYRPVCGSDGQTYSNPCDFNNAFCTDPQLTISSLGECETDIRCLTSFCTSEYQPLCGSDGVTYENICTFSNAFLCHDSDLTIAYDGECTQSTISCSEQACTSVYEPVCGTDGQTYSNMCVFTFTATCGKDGDLRLAHKGECGTGVKCSDNICTSIFEPVCGSDGHTYANLCQFNFSAECGDTRDLKLRHTGQCESPPEEETLDCSNRQCTREYAPICGSDGQTYNNPCLYAYATYCDELITVVYGGPCRQDADINCARRSCSRQYQPVCGSNGETYNNLCLFKYAVHCDDETLTRVAEGPCDRVDPALLCKTRTCTADYNPVCGSNMETYPNQCTFEFAVTCDISSLTKLHDGECILPNVIDNCEPRPVCTDDYSPICGSNGVTYPNICAFDVAVLCDDNQLTQTHEGSCGRVRFERERLVMVLPRGRKPIIRLDVTASIPSDSSDLEGDNLWKLEMFGSRSNAINTTGQYEYRAQVLDAEQAGRPAIAGRNFAIRNIRTRFPLWEAACNGYRYLCARFSPTDGDHPDDFSILTCNEVECP